jgi:hypothetical protein
LKGLQEINIYLISIKKNGVDLGDLLKVLLYAFGCESPDFPLEKEILQTCAFQVLQVLKETGQLVVRFNY